MRKLLVISIVLSIVAIMFLAGCAPVCDDESCSGEAFRALKVSKEKTTRLSCHGNDLVSKQGGQEIDRQSCYQCVPGKGSATCYSEEGYNELLAKSKNSDTNNPENKDSDHDTVNDEYDECMNTPLNSEVSDFGCPDSDGDGFYDNADNCPLEKPEVDVDPKDGCEDDFDAQNAVESAVDFAITSTDVVQCSAEYSDSSLVCVSPEELTIFKETCESTGGLFRAHCSATDKPCDYESSVDSPDKIITDLKTSPEVTSVKYDASMIPETVVDPTTIKRTSLLTAYIAYETESVVYSTDKVVYTPTVDSTSKTVTTTLDKDTLVESGIVETTAEVDKVVITDTDRTNLLAGVEEDVVGDKTTIEEPAQRLNELETVIVPTTINSVEEEGVFIPVKTLGCCVACIPPTRTCFDSDGEDYMVKGIVTDENNVELGTDTCVSDHTLEEYVCKDGVPDKISLDCREEFGPDYVCKEGVCVK